MYSFGLNSTNLNGPVPIGRCRISRRDMAGIYRCVAGSQIRQQSRLRVPQAEDDFIFAINGHPFEVAVPGFARIYAELFTRYPRQHFPSAFDIGSGKGLAVVPFDTM